MVRICFGNNVSWNFWKYSPDFFGLGPFPKLRALADNLIDARLRDGYDVQTEIVSNDDLRSALRDSHLYEFYYFGHGGGGVINTDGNTGVFPGKYTKYGISKMYLYSCESAYRIGATMKSKKTGETWDVTSPDSILWRYNVSEYGKFVGYANSFGGMSIRSELVGGYPDPGYGYDWTGVYNPDFP